MPRKSLRRDKKDYIKRSFDKNRAINELAREDKIEKNILAILKAEWNSGEEGRGYLTLECLYDDARREDKTLNLKDFTNALERLSGDGLFRSKKRIRFMFQSSGKKIQLWIRIGK